MHMFVKFFDNLRRILRNSWEYLGILEDHLGNRVLEAGTGVWVGVMSAGLSDHDHPDPEENEWTGLITWILNYHFQSVFNQLVSKA